MDCCSRTGHILLHSHLTPDIKLLSHNDFYPTSYFSVIMQSKCQLFRFTLIMYIISVYLIFPIPAQAKEVNPNAAFAANVSFPGTCTRGM